MKIDFRRGDDVVPGFLGEFVVELNRVGVLQ
jgi:hypothetical protein